MTASTRRAAVLALEYHLPQAKLSNADLALAFPDWTAEKIADKTGILERRIAAKDQTAADLAAAAAERLFAVEGISPETIDFLLFCTQTPDYALPTSACVLQARLGLPRTAGALDYNLGCSGFTYGLSVAKAMIESDQAQRVLLLTADTYSKLMDPGDRNVRTIFGDAGAATLVAAVDDGAGRIFPGVFGTDGRGAEHLMCRRGGFRTAAETTPGGASLWMNGPEIFNFTIRVIPECVGNILGKSNLTADRIDLFVFHQANRFMLDHLRKKLGIAPEKFFVSMAHCGNTVSSSIPIALRDAQSQGRLKSGMKLMLLGFGVGLSWGGQVLEWR